MEQVNKVFLMFGQATTMLVTTTVIKSEDEEEEKRKMNEESVCLTSLVMSACKCLPWQYNWQGEEQPCAGGDTGRYNCSQTVGGLHEAAGGDCQLAMALVEQRMRISLPADVRQACKCAAAGNRVEHFVRQVGGRWSAWWGNNDDAGCSCWVWSKDWHPDYDP